VRGLLGPLAALALVGLLAGGCAGDEQPVDLPLGRQVSATATLDPSVHLFAEPVVARLEVVVDRDHLDPARVRTRTRFLPYDVERVVREREDRGRFTLLRYEYTLRCLRIACIPEVLPSAAGEAESGRGERRAFDLPGARVLYAETTGEARSLRVARWPELVSVSRIKASDVPSFGFVFKTSVTPLPEPDYRVSPTLLGAGLIVGALFLLALPAVLVAGWLRTRRPTPVVADEPELTPLERALRLVEWARERENGAERREALEVLAVELDAAASSELAKSARALAWSPASPSPDEAGRLVVSVRKSDDRS
jgi:hypothetical protein